MSVEFFEITIRCRQCESTNCDHYIKEPGEDGTWDAGYIHICPYEIRYRCKDCGQMMDRRG